jgi:methylenetetrahydrofolate reductase (NADPH)
MESQKRHPQIFSCEFFPPTTDEAVEKLHVTRRQLASLHPAYFSVTYGAGGSTRNRTLEAVLDIQLNCEVDAAPHLTCIASTRENIRAILNHYRSHRIRRIVALRGDIPAGMRNPGQFRHANELVEFIRAETGDYFHIEVAAYPEFHPQAPTPAGDLANFKRKVETGANSAITQYFYNPDAYFYFIDSCQKMGMDLPIVPGIMPITNYSQLVRFSDACGAEIPRWIRKRLEGFDDDRESIRAFGLDVVTELCARLLEQGAPGLHFYTMNQAEPTLAIWERLGLPR